MEVEGLLTRKISIICRSASLVETPASKAFSFDLVKKGSDLFNDEFPSYKDIIETKEKIEKI